MLWLCMITAMRSHGPIEYHVLTEQHKLYVWQQGWAMWPEGICCGCGQWFLGHGSE
jgi:hypothetical protein